MLHSDPGPTNSLRGPDFARLLINAKSTFENLGKILKDRKLSLGTKCRVLECYVISTLMYRSGDGKEAASYGDVVLQKNV